MPLIGNGVKSKTAGKSGLNNRIYQLFYGISRKHAEINTEKVSLSTGPTWNGLKKQLFYHEFTMIEYEPWYDGKKWGRLHQNVYLPPIDYAYNLFSFWG